jgi:hypothetical protein
MSFSDVKNKFDDTYEQTKDFMDIHMKSLVTTPMPDMSFSVESVDPVRTSFYLQFLSNVPGYKKLLDTLNSTSGIRNTYESAEQDLEKSSAFVSALDENEKNKLIKLINKKIDKVPLLKLKFDDATAAPPTQGGGADSFYETQKGKLDGITDALKSTDSKSELELEGKKYLVTKHENTRVFPYFGRKDDDNRKKYDFEYMDKETSEIDAIKRCIL